MISLSTARTSDSSLQFNKKLSKKRSNKFFELISDNKSENKERLQVS